MLTNAHAEPTASAELTAAAPHAELRVVMAAATARMDSAPVETSAVVATTASATPVTRSRSRCFMSRVVMENSGVPSVYNQFSSSFLQQCFISTRLKYSVVC